jgi:TonB family protein
LLDQAALAMVEQASPLPKPPPSIMGQQVTFSVPVRFHSR